MRSHLIALVCWLFAVTSEAQTPANRFQCAFTTIASADGVKRARFDLEFIVDTITGKAVVVGNGGMSDVWAHPGSVGLTFVEELATGALQTTTISSTGAAVHSRHTMINGDLVPSQYYGTCR